MIVDPKAPFYDVRDGLPHPAPPSGTSDVLLRAIGAVGRIEVPDAPMEFVGTGFLVGEGLVLTNRNIAQQFADGLGNKGLALHRDARIDFGREVGGETAASVPIIGVRLVHPYWDVAILEVGPVSPPRAPLRLQVRPPSDSRTVAVVGYPAMDTRGGGQVQKDLLRDVSGRKRVSMGRMRPGIVQVEMPGARRIPAVQHEANTTAGVGGAPLVDVETGLVLGIHFAWFKDANSAVPAWELARDPRVAHSGVLFAEPPIAMFDLERDGRWLEVLWADRLDVLYREVERVAAVQPTLASDEMFRMVRKLRLTRGPAPENYDPHGKHTLGTLLMDAFRSRFPKLYDDPLAAAFGGFNERQGFGVDAKIERQGSSAFWRVEGAVSAPPWADMLSMPTLHLHPSLRQSTLPVPWQVESDGLLTAPFSFGTAGSFTMGVNIERRGGDPIRLELDLAECDGADADFQAR